MTPEEIQALYVPDQFECKMLHEIAWQLAVLNQRESKRATKKQGGAHAPTGTGTVRRSSTTKLFWVHSWQQRATMDMLANIFSPKDGFKSLDELVVGESTEGRLGTNQDAKIDRRL